MFVLFTRLPIAGGKVNLVFLNSSPLEARVRSVFLLTASERGTLGGNLSQDERNILFFLFLLLEGSYENGQVIAQRVGKSALFLIP